MKSGSIATQVAVGVAVVLLAQFLVRRVPLVRSIIEGK